jgi:hypothetical protein
MTTDRSRVPGYLAAGLAMVAMAVIGVFYVSAGLVAPLWAVILLLIIWVVLVVIGVVWFRRRPFLVLLLPVIAVLVWFGVITLGEQLLGWTA